MSGLESRVAAQNLANCSNTNDVTNDLKTLNFENGLNEYEERYKILRARHHCMTVISVAHATFLVSLVNKVRQIIAEKKYHVNEKTMEFYNKTKSRDPIKVGLIGCGRLGKQIVSSLLYFADVRTDEIIVSTRQPESLDNLQQAGIKCICNNRQLVQESDIVFLCFSPSSLVSVVDDIQGHIPQSTLIFSFLAAVYLDRLKSMLKFDQITRIKLQILHKNINCSWMIGNDVITSLLDDDVVELCCPTSSQTDKMIITPPTKTIEVSSYYIINMLMEMKIKPKEILDLLNQALFSDGKENNLAWNDLLFEDQLTFYEENGYPPQFNISNITSNRTPLTTMIQSDEYFREHFNRLFLSTFSRNNHKDVSA